MTHLPTIHSRFDPKRDVYSRLGLEPFDLALARLMDRQADHALHLGYRNEAERLAHRAAELRGAA